MKTKPLMETGNEMLKEGGGPSRETESYDAESIISKNTVVDSYYCESSYSIARCRRRKSLTHRRGDRSPILEGEQGDKSLGVTVS